MNSIVSEKRFISERIGVPYENLSQSYLRAETELTNQSVIDFVLQSNKKQNQIVTERLLDLNDEFVVTHYTVAIKYVEGLTPPAGSAAQNAEQLSAALLTYANGQIVGPPSASTLESIYNSDLNWTIDRKEFVPQFPVRSFKRVPTTQGSPATQTQDGFDNGLYGFYPSEPTKIDGRQTLDLAINLGNSTDFTAGATGRFYAVFEARGYLIVNAKS